MPKGYISSSKPKARPLSCVQAMAAGRRRRAVLTGRKLARIGGKYPSKYNSRSCAKARGEAENGGFAHAARRNERQA